MSENSDSVGLLKTACPATDGKVGGALYGDVCEALIGPG